MSSPFRGNGFPLGKPFAAAALAAASVAIACAATLPVVVVRAPAASVRLEVAVTPDQQERGLMYRTSLPPHTGMLFVFDADQEVAFWMKDTLVPLDMCSSQRTVRCAKFSPT